MIPRVIDPAPRAEPSLQPAAAREGDGETPVRFADLLGVTAMNAATPTIEDRPAGDPDTNRTPDAHARLFNQDGFFGHASSAPPTAEFAVATSVAPPTVLDGPVDAALMLSAEPVGTSEFPVGNTRPNGPSPSTSRPVTAPRRAVVAGFARAAAPPLATTSLHPQRTEPASTPTRAASARRPLPQPAAMVAVALHAAARGIEVAAQVAGLDEHDRAALADEIAALLSSHGYAPTRVSVATPPLRNLRQEHR